MDVADYGDGRKYVYDVGLFHELLFELVAYCLDYRFGEELFLVEALDALIEVD